MRQRRPRSGAFLDEAIRVLILIVAEQGPGIRGFGIDNGALVPGDLAPERLGVALRRLGIDVEAGQLAQQFAGLGEADAGRGEAGHAQGRRRQRGSRQAQRPVARA